MSTVRQALFKEGSNSWTTETIDEKQNIDEVDNNSAEIVEYTVVSEGDVTFKAQLVENLRGLKTPQEKVLQRGTSSFYEKDLNKKILIVYEGTGEKLRQTWTELKRLKDLRVESCYCTDLITVCTKETFLLIFLEMSSVSGHAQKLCSTVRYNPNSLNRSVAIIGIVEERSKEDFSAHGINDFIYLPVTDEKMNQVLLKWAGQKSCEGMPLTPESPEDRIPVTAASKVLETIKGNEGVSSSLVSYNNNSNISPSVQKSCNRISQADSCTSATESLFKQPQLHVSQSTSHNQQPFASVIQCVSSNGNRIHNRGLTDHTQNHNGFQQPNSQVVSSFTAPQHFVHSGNPYQDNPPSSLFVSRSAPEHIPVNGGVVPGHITGMVNPVYPPEHCNQSYAYHHNQPSNPNRQSPISHFLPINPPPLYPSTHSPNTGGFGSTHATSSKADHEQHPASNQTLADYSSVKMVGSPAYMISGPLGSKDMKITLLHDDLSKHSSKERIRRERIKESCDQLRFLLPSVAGKKSDMASILEMTVKYVRMVKERMPPSVLQEISENIIETTTVLPRKRPNRDAAVPTKQAKSRLTPATSVHEQGAPRLPHSLQPFIMRSAPFQGKAPTMVTTTGPMYVPHLHIRAGHEHMQIPMQQHHQHPSEPVSFRPATSPPLAFDSCTAGSSIRGANVLQHLPPHNHTMINLHQECNGPHPFHPKPVYHGNQHTVPQGAAGHSCDMPQQWSFLKLPAIGNIFHSLSSSDLSQGSSKQDSSESRTPSPADSSPMTPPLWENSGSMISSRQDDARMETSPNLYKGSSM